MKTVKQQKKNVRVIAACCLIVACFGLPGISLAELKPMTDSEMKTTRLNDFIRPSGRPIIVGQQVADTKDIEKELREVQAPVIATQDVYEPEAIINDMQTQLDRINNGEAPVIGLFPFIQTQADKQHLLKQ
ncbi:MAG: hypothetical protein C0403_15885 [Desulfobacterium sp.]|nr:hypothetical protein [Desulfobacterium sp.]